MMEMDPKSVLQMVRDKKRLINDSYVPQKQLTNSNASIFQMPPLPPPLQPQPKQQTHRNTSTYPFIGSTASSMPSGQKYLYANNNKNPNENENESNYVPSHHIHHQHQPNHKNNDNRVENANYSSTSSTKPILNSDNSAKKQNYELTYPTLSSISLSNKLNNESNSNNSFNSNHSINKNIKNLQQAKLVNTINNENLYINNYNPNQASTQSSTNLNHYQHAMSNHANKHEYSQIDTISRSGSVKSVASDSGIGSSSPLSDCSDNGTNNFQGGSSSTKAKKIQSQSHNNDVVITHVGHSQKHQNSDSRLIQQQNQIISTNGKHEQSSKIQIARPIAINHNYVNNRNNFLSPGATAPLPPPTLTPVNSLNFQQINNQQSLIPNNINNDPRSNSSLTSSTSSLSSISSLSLNSYSSNESILSEMQSRKRKHESLSIPQVIYHQAEHLNEHQKNYINQAYSHNSQYHTSPSSNELNKRCDKECCNHFNIMAHNKQQQLAHSSQQKSSFIPLTSQSSTLKNDTGSPSTNNTNAKSIQNDSNSQQQMHMQIQMQSQINGNRQLQHMAILNNASASSLIPVCTCKDCNSEYLQKKTNTKLPVNSSIHYQKHLSNEPQNNSYCNCSGCNKNINNVQQMCQKNSNELNISTQMQHHLQNQHIYNQQNFYQQQQQSPLKPLPVMLHQPKSNFCTCQECYQVTNAKQGLNPTLYSKFSPNQTSIQQHYHQHQISTNANGSLLEYNSNNQSNKMPILTLGGVESTTQNRHLQNDAKSYEDYAIYEKYFSKILKKNSSPAILTTMYQSSLSSPNNKNLNLNNLNEQNSVSAALLSDDYSDLINNGLHIKKLKNDFYSFPSLNNNPNDIRNNKIKRKSLESALNVNKNDSSLVALSSFQTVANKHRLDNNDYLSKSMSPLSARSISPSSSPSICNSQQQHSIIGNYSHSSAYPNNNNNGYLSPSPSKKSKPTKFTVGSSIYDMAEVNNYYKTNSLTSSAEKDSNTNHEMNLLKKSKNLNYYYFNDKNANNIELGEVLDNDVELGEVIIDKIKNPALVDQEKNDGCMPEDSDKPAKLPTQLSSNKQSLSPISSSASPTPSLTPKAKTPDSLIDTTNSNISTSDEDIPVTLSKKILPMVTPRILDWLERCVEFINKISTKTNVDIKNVFDLLTRAWPKLLVIYMIENSFDFFVTPDRNQLAKLDAAAEEIAIKTKLSQQQENDNAETSSTLSTQEHEKNLIKMESDKLPKQKDVKQLQNLIVKGNLLNFNSEEYDDLREIVLFKEGGDEPIYFKAFLNAQTNLKETIDSNETIQREFTKLLVLLQNIYEVKTEIIENLFCRNLNDSKNVVELLNRKFQNISDKSSSAKESD